MEPTASAIVPGAGPAASPLETARVWTLHLLCFVLPLTCLAYLLSAPHGRLQAWPWFLVVVGSVIADMRSPSELRQPAADMSQGPFDAVLYLLVALHLLNVALLVRMVALHGFWSANTLVGLLLVGIDSGYCGIVVAHELIHRPQRHMIQLGRLLLSSVLYEHFTVEHVRGHHARVGTPEDPATARFGETAVAFLLRTVPAQFRSAWRLEKKRLGNEDMAWNDPRMLENRCLHGLVFEWGVALLVLVLLGRAPFAIYVLQAVMAVRLLEAVNYFEHWGLARTGRKVTPIDSWDTDSRFTLYTLVGLSRHADHHAHAARPYAQLRHFDESPKLPFGYFGTVFLLLFRNAEFRRLMTRELRRRKLGPFAPGADATEAASTAAAAAVA